MRNNLRSVRAVKTALKWSLLLLAAPSLTSAQAAESPVKIYAAGSLTSAMKEMIEVFGEGPDAFAPPVFGPAGGLAVRLTKGETADIYASADSTHPVEVAAAIPHALVVPFARNRMCVVSKASSGLTADNLLEKFLAAPFRLATSTPVIDPGGDYAMAVFDKADALKPGAGKTLREKAMHLLGDTKTMVPVAGHSPAASIFMTDRADALIYYCSGAPALLKDVPGLVSLPMPDALEVHPIYSFALMTSNAVAARFGLFMLSSKGQSILAHHGFRPIAVAGP